MAGNLTRFSPFNDIARFEPFGGLEDLLRDFRLMPSLQALENGQSMKMDVAENEKQYIVKADIPGVKKEDIKIDIDGNQISIVAETSQVKEEKEGESIVRSERFSGRQYRGFSLAHEIDAANALAKYQDGVLELTLPKKSRNGTKQIAVS